MDLLRISLTYQENNGGSVRCGVIRQTFDPLFINPPAFRNCVHVRTMSITMDISWGGNNSLENIIHVARSEFGFSLGLSNGALQLLRPSDSNCL